ncbi:MAG: hypothetical protein LBQ70_02550 [Prevotellaceae bacterium]|jgi:hypothetical protein|nr:hypothetical protein [Prevotellaceae bacterium]
METKFTEQESLAVISEMIDRARNNIQKGSANTMIFNGCTVAFVAVANFALLHLLPEECRNKSFMVWWLMVPFSVVDHFMKRGIDRSAIVKTHIDSIIKAIWRGFGTSIVVLLVVIFSASYAFDKWTYTLFITPVIMIMVGIAQFAMSKVCRYRPFFWSAVYFWAGAVLCSFTYCVLKRGDLHFLILAVCMIVGFVIPGYILNKKAEKNV